jgi:MFS superfamily sulfate permease-like transporter
LLTLWRLGRDEWLAACAVAAVVGLGVLQGMLLAVLLSLIAALRRFSQSRVAVLGDLAGSRDFVDTALHDNAVQTPGVLVVRPEQPLFFANAERVLAVVRQRVEPQAGLLVLVLSLEESTDLDSTAIETLAEFKHWLEGTGRCLLLARVKEPVRVLLGRGPAGFAPPFATDACFWSVADAVDAAQRALTGSSAAGHR